MSDRNTKWGRACWGGGTACAKAQGQGKVVRCGWVMGRLWETRGEKLAAARRPREGVSTFLWTHGIRGRIQNRSFSDIC